MSVEFCPKCGEELEEVREDQQFYCEEHGHMLVTITEMPEPD